MSTTKKLKQDRKREIRTPVLNIFFAPSSSFTKGNANSRFKVEKGSININTAAKVARIPKSSGLKSRLNIG